VGVVREWREWRERERVERTGPHICCGGRDEDSLPPSLLTMDRESDPSYLEWVRLKDSSTSATGRDVVELASKLIEELYEKLSESNALYEASSREFGTSLSLFAHFYFIPVFSAVVFPKLTVLLAFEDQKTHVLDQAAASYQQATQNALFELKQSQVQCQALRT